MRGMKDVAQGCDGGGGATVAHSARANAHARHPHNRMPTYSCLALLILISTTHFALSKITTKNSAKNRSLPNESWKLVSRNTNTIIIFKVFHNQTLKSLSKSNSMCSTPCRIKEKNTN